MIVYAGNKKACHSACYSRRGIPGMFFPRRNCVAGVSGKACFPLEKRLVRVDDGN